MATLLGEVGGREIDRDPARRQGEPGCDERCPHALPGLADCLVGKADDVERRQARCDLHLHINRARLDTFECDRGNSLDHLPLAKGRIAETDRAGKNN